MSVLYIVLPLAILLAIAAVLAFSWAVRTGQMDDLQTPALRILHDDVQVKSRGEGGKEPGAPASSLARSGSERLSSVTGADPRSTDPHRTDALDANSPISNRDRLSSTCAETPHARARLSHNDG